jgi:hypothetical protein
VPEQNQPSKFAEYREILDFVLIRIGFPAVILGLVLWFHFNDWKDYKKEVSWKLERINRNARAIMQKLDIPIILDGDRKE